ncbi:MAG: heme o synthase [Terriglobales bacterium]
MSSKPPVTVLNAPAVEGRLVSVSTLLSDYWALTKPEVNFLILITTFAGFYLGCANAGRQFSFLASFNTLLGTLLVASGTATLNQYIERRFDAQMRRTSRRPLAAGRLEPSAVLAFGIGLSAAGTVYLAMAAGVFASLLALLTLLSYLFLYTPLKRRTPLCVLIGAFPGAMPPLIGWAAASGRLNVEAWLLYCIVFLWQFPHFMAIAWMYREDYDRAGYMVLPQGRSRFHLVTLQTMLPLLALIVISLAPTLPGTLALLYQLGTLALSFVFFYCGSEFVLRRSRPAARRLLMASILYLPLLLLLMTLGKAQRT